MICKECNVNMKTGTSYEKVNGKISAKRYSKCPVCHFRKYNNLSNVQETTINKSNKRK